jgi:formylglycine-generating enzyme required for sulfatase activity
MLSNVAEWVEDCYVKNYSDAPADGSAVTAQQCAARVIRGGSWDSSPRDVRAAYRYFYSPEGATQRYRVSAGQSDWVLRSQALLHAPA